MKYRLFGGAAAALLFALPLAAQSDWTSFGHDPGQTRYSPLDQINASNASQLQQAWVYHLKSAEATSPLPPGCAAIPAATKPLSQATPLVADGVMFLPTPYCSVIALNPITGELIWTYKLEVSRVQNRTLSYWHGDKITPASVLFATSDGHLMSLNAKTGKPTTGFGENGLINLKDGMYDDVPGNTGRYYMTSPGSIYKNLLITGSDVQETPFHGPSGDVRAWDMHTGKLAWRFHTVPRPGEVGHETWPEDGWKGRSGTNMWGFSSVDVERGLVFMPIGSATSDNWGGDRKGDNLFSDSLVAVHADTGKLAWHFQTIHHDIYDYDLESAPVLVTVHREGKVIPAVAVIGKAGLMYILDRRNGKPVFGVEERPVPQSTSPGEQSSPTQPFPIKPVPLGRQTFSHDEIANVTPEHHDFCEKMFATEGGMDTASAPFTPYGSKLTIIFPSTVGVVNWHGMSYNPKLGYLFVNTNEIGSVGKIAKRPEGSDPPYDRTSPWNTYAEFEDTKKYWPCQQPPWGLLWAINVNTGDVAWKEPFGTIPELEAKGVKGTGSLNYGGSITTGGGLIFIAASDDEHFRAINGANGKIVWDIKMDTGAYVTPSTYLGKDGKQYVAIVSTGGSFFDKTSGDSILGFALPGKAPATKAAAKLAAKPETKQAAKPATSAKPATK